MCERLRKKLLNNIKYLLVYNFVITWVYYNHNFEWVQKIVCYVLFTPRVKVESTIQKIFIFFLVFLVLLPATLPCNDIRWTRVIDTHCTRLLTDDSRDENVIWLCFFSYLRNRSPGSNFYSSPPFHVFQ